MKTGKWDGWTVGVFGPFLKSFISLIEKPHWNFEAALFFLDGHCDVDNYYTFWAPSNMFSVGINNRHIARTMTSLFPSHELHHHHHQHQHQLRPWLVTSPPFNPLRLPGSVGEKPLSCVWLGQKPGGWCRWCRCLQESFRSSRCQATFRRGGGELGKLRVGLGEII